MGKINNYNLYMSKLEEKAEEVRVITASLERVKRLIEAHRKDDRSGVVRILPPIIVK